MDNQTFQILINKIASDIAKEHQILLDKIANIQVRLLELEEWTRKDEDRIYSRIEKLAERVDALESFINKHWSSKRHEPHKCPVCEGSGGIKHPLTGLVEPAKCHACKGEGVLWG